MIDPKDQKIVQMEKQLAKLVQQVAELNRRIGFLERENNRRKIDINQVSNKKG
jgi:uncharacterized small protein (DUF1192 family)